MPDTHSSPLLMRPSSLEKFVGQKTLVQNLTVFIQAALGRQETLDHCLFSGPPGLGKTTIARLIAREMGANLCSTAGPTLSHSGDLASLLTNLQPNDILFIDEIHRLPPAVEETLYPAMEDCKLDILIGEGPTARSLSIDLPPFTLVGATTRSGLLTSPFRERFGIAFALYYYSTDELEEILKNSAQALSIAIDEDALFTLAKRSRGTPRRALRLLRRVRDFSETMKENSISKITTEKSLESMKIDTLGLEILDQRYLSVLHKQFRGGPVGLDTLSTVLSEPKDVIEDVIEPFLLQQSLIHKTPRGRLLTRGGFAHLGARPTAQILSLKL